MKYRAHRFSPSQVIYQTNRLFRVLAHLRDRLVSCMYELLKIFIIFPIRQKKKGKRNKEKVELAESGRAQKWVVVLILILKHHSAPSQSVNVKGRIEIVWKRHEPHCDYWYIDFAEAWRMMGSLGWSWKGTSGAHVHGPHSNMIRLNVRSEFTQGFLF